MRDPGSLLPRGDAKVAWMRGGREVTNVTVTIHCVRVAKRSMQFRRKTTAGRTASAIRA